MSTARNQALAMVEHRSGPFADVVTWRTWRWNPAWPLPGLGDSRPSRSHRQ